MKKILVGGLLFGLAATLLVTFMSATLRWSDIGAVCPGVSYETRAKLIGGFPLEYRVTTLPAMGTCGKITSSPSPTDRMRAIAYPLFLVNFGIWSCVFWAIFSLVRGVKPRANKNLRT